MKNSICVSAAVIAVLLASGCSSGKTDKAPEPVRLGNFSQADDESAKALAFKFASGFEAALLGGSFVPFQKLLPPSTRLNAHEFAKLRSSLIQLYGNPVKLEYITFLDQGQLRDYLWRLKFVSPAASGKVQGSKEILFCVRMYCEQGKLPGIAGFSFRRF